MSTPTNDSPEKNAAVELRSVVGDDNAAVTPTQAATVQQGVAPAESSVITTEAMLQWLAQHPELFCQHPEMLEVMVIPHQPGKPAASLIERQVERLREALQQQEQRLSEFLQIANRNEQLSARLHELVLAVLNANDLDSAVNVLINGLREDFNAEEVSLFLLGSADLEHSDVQLFSSETAADNKAKDNNRWQQALALVAGGKPAVGRASEHSQLFFADADKVGSMVCLPVGRADITGVLAIGSPREDRFPPGTSTDLLQRLTELVATKLSVLAIK